MPRLKAKDIIALVIILGMFLMVLTGEQSMVPPAVMLILGYYFAKREKMEDPGI